MCLFRRLPWRLTWQKRLPIYCNTSHIDAYFWCCGCCFLCTGSSFEVISAEHTRLHLDDHGVSNHRILRPLCARVRPPKVLAQTRHNYTFSRRMRLVCWFAG